MTSKLTPMLQQYTAIKNEHQDVILMFRLGDFYEMFGDDAITASKVLEITLTSRDAGKGGRIPMCGVPYHAVDRYIAKLISNGHRVAICDQVEDPKLTKGIVRREVTRVVTAGTVLEDTMLDSKSNNYLVAPSEYQNTYGLSVIDISTGEFLLTESSDDNASQQIIDEIIRLSPSELLIPEEKSEWITKIESACSCSKTTFEPDGFVSPKEILLKHFSTSSLRGFGCEDYTAGLKAGATIIKYLEKTQSSALKLITSLATYSTSGYMILDAPARRNLELTQSMFDGSKNKSLLQVIDKTVTPMGARMIRRWIDQPLLDLTEINNRLSIVNGFFSTLMTRTRVRESMAEISDIERLTSRISAGTANARDLIALKTSLNVFPSLVESLSALNDSRIDSLCKPILSVAHIANIIENAIIDEPPITVKEGGVIRAGFNSDLDNIRSASKDGKGWIAALESEEREKTGIKSLKIGYNSVFGYYIEVSKSNLSLVPDDYIRKQTTVNAERFITSKLKELELIVLGADEKSTQLEYEIFCAIRDEISKDAQNLMQAARSIAEIDVYCGLAEAAALNRYILPEVNNGSELIIKNGRHPVVERLQTNELFVPNDTQLDCEENQLLIITGPNMAGKSTYLRQVALIVLMAQIGSFVPADSASIGIVDRIFTRVGAHDELYSGQSTFMVEMNETANILNNATDKSLIILDEIGRGTSTYDGLSIAWAVAEYIKKIGAKTLFATHYHHLNDLARTTPGIKNYRIAVREDEDRIVWLRKIMPGGTDKSYGIQVAKLAGLPDEVVERAKDVLMQLESSSNVSNLVNTGKINTKTKNIQLTLFESEQNPLLLEIEEMDVSAMTPIEALTHLYDIQNRIKQKNN